MSASASVQTPACMACGGDLEFLGVQGIRMGGASGGFVAILGNWGEVGEWVWDVAVFRSAGCGHFDLYDKDSPLAEQMRKAHHRGFFSR